MAMPFPLIGAGEPAPFALVNARGASPFLLTGDHAGNAVPRALEGLGLPARERARHIGLDIGVLGLGKRLSALLDAPFIHQPYSRLVIDCNRDPASPAAMPAASDGTAIPANAALDAGAREARIAAIHRPYHAAIGELLAARGPTILIALHSFTPRLGRIERPWPAGILYGGGDESFARALLAALRARLPLVGDNQPYAFDGTDYSVPHHAFAAGLAYAEIEVRQDLIADVAGQEGWAARLAEALRVARDDIFPPT